MDIAITLRQARIAAGLEQKELARLMEVSPGFLSDLEKGRRAFHDRYLEWLPDTVREPVREALIELKRAEIRYLMQG